MSARQLVQGPGRGSSWDIYREEGTTGNLPTSAFKQSTVYACSDGDWTPLSKRAEHTVQASNLSLPASGGLSVSCPQQYALFQPLQSPGGSRPSTPKSDSELVTKPSGKGKQDNPQMLWAWGKLPQAAKPSFLTPKPESPMLDQVSIPVSDSMYFLVISGDCAPERQEECHPPLTLYIPEPRDGEGEGGAAPGLEMEGMGAAAAHLMSEMDEVAHGPGPRPLSKTDSPSKKKDKRSHHLGADGVYLDDITELEPEVAALYFPKSDGGGAVRVCSEGEARSTSMSPQSASSSGVDSGVDSYSDQIGDLPSITISLCGGLTENMEITKGRQSVPP
ncbi:hypothetical protein SKAU_G00193750 [Synaphobranchus kaupii]|uniref:Uncharacterized protein n=1 Tax=Synaphobranchus kaupii TaxID=118154 RepID=A0A9Q1FE17_SYNKA|nr:hypothetical protein SKAU_G00193750 [Synaphobranchus kaupii]